MVEQIAKTDSHQKFLESELKKARAEVRTLAKLPDMSNVIEERNKMNLSAELTFEQRRCLLQSIVSKIQITNDGQISIVLKDGIQRAI